MTVGVFVGGLGDLVLCLDAIKRHDAVKIHSHQNACIDFLEIFGLSDRAIPIAIGEQFRGHPYTNETYITPSSFSTTIKDFQNDTKEEGLVYNTKTVLHACGSAFANSFAKHNNLPLKKISTENVWKFIQKFKADGVILGSKEDLDANGIALKALPLREQLIATLHCKEFIGIDSFFKTVRLSAGLKAKVVIPDYADPYRDMVFINPYMDKNLIKLYRYSSIEEFDISRTYE